MRKQKRNFDIAKLTREAYTTNRNHGKVFWCSIHGEICEYSKILNEVQQPIMVDSFINTTKVH